VWLTLTILVLAVGSILFTQRPRPAEQILGQFLPRNEAQFVADVVLRTELGDPSRVCHRWVQSPSVYVANATPSQEQLVGDVLSQLNTVLEGTGFRLKNELGKPFPTDDAQPRIEVTFARQRDFAQIAVQENIDVPSDSQAFFWMYWNSRAEITRGRVVLPSERTLDDLRHLALEEITQVLGLPGDSAVFKNSVFYELPRASAWGTATTLSSLDRRLLRFLYKCGAPNMNATQLAAAIDRDW